MSAHAGLRASQARTFDDAIVPELHFNQTTLRSTTTLLCLNRNTASIRDFQMMVVMVVVEAM